MTLVGVFIAYLAMKFIVKMHCKTNQITVNSYSISTKGQPHCALRYGGDKKL
jgi:hypothetical protein